MSEINKMSRKKLFIYTDGDFPLDPNNVFLSKPTTLPKLRSDYSCCTPLVSYKAKDIFSDLFIMVDELEKENAKLREALRNIANDESNEEDIVCKHYTNLKDQAREVLNGKK